MASRGAVASPDPERRAELMGECVLFDLEPRDALGVVPGLGLGELLAQVEEACPVGGLRLGVERRASSV